MVRNEGETAQGKGRPRDEDEEAASPAGASHADGAGDFWEDPDVVEAFAARPPDTRMVERLTDAPRSTRVLDLGCAGGRNAVWLAEHGFDLQAVDASAAMCARTRDRLTPLLGRAEAEQRVRRRSMDDLAPFERGAFDVVLAFGIFHAAQSERAWHRAVAEAARVLVTGGEMWVAHFAPDSNPTGEGLRRVDGEDHLYEGFRGHRRILLLPPDELDAWAAGHGFVPATPTEAVRVVRGEGHRTTVNARYRLRGA